MKTTIEIHGYQIVIEESEGNISVSALKDDETVEEFTLESAEGEGEEGEEGLHAFGDEEAQEGDFDDAEGEEDFEGEEGEVELEEPSEGGDEDYEEDLEDVEEEGKLESFNSFIRKRK